MLATDSEPLGPPPEAPTVEQRLEHIESRLHAAEVNPRPVRFGEVLESVPWYGWLYFGVFLGAALARRNA